MRFDIFIFYIYNYTNLLSFGFLNKLSTFPKFENNSIAFMIFNTFIFRANYTISKIATQFFCISLT